MIILYLINQYPKNSHTFVRREILGIEALGMKVVRVSIRPFAHDLVEAADRQEAQHTQVILRNGSMGLLPSVLAVGFKHPIRFLGALLCTLRLARRAERGLGFHLAYLGEACVLLKICQTESVDHIHTHFGTNPPLVAMLVKALGGPGFSFTIHGAEEYHRGLGLKLAEKVADARFVVAISRFGRSQLQIFARQNTHDRIHIVHCGLDSAFLDNSNVPSPSGSHFLFVGRLCQLKQPLTLLEAAAILAADGVDFHLDIAGDGELFREMETAVRKHKLEPYVTLHGTVDGAEVRRLILASRAMVLSSSAEGLPVVLMESMALQRPVVTTFIAAIPELVRPGIEGWLVPTGHAQALATAMAQALNCSSEELARMGKAAASRVRERHDIRISAERMVQLFQQYIKNPSA
jgi:glycosyltransferase involved in cell wall biosynthesis